MVNHYYYLNIVIKEYISIFFAQREKAAKTYHAKWASFLAIIREEHHPLRPEHYHNLNPIWQHFGYKINENLMC